MIIIYEFEPILSRCWKQLLAASLTKTKKLCISDLPRSLFGTSNCRKCNWTLTLAESAVKKKQNRDGIIDATCCFCDKLTKDGIVILPMETPQIKSEIIRAIEDLPDDATVEDAMERLYFLAKIERGLEQSESGETVSHAEIKARFLR